MQALPRWAIAFGLLTVLLWPRYLFVSLAGKGVSGYTLVSLALPTLAALYALVSVRWRVPATAGWLRAAPLLFVLVLNIAWQIVTCFTGETPGASLNVTIQTNLFLVGWAWSASVFYTDARALRDIPVLASGAIVVATVIGLIDYRTHLRVIDFPGIASIVSIDATSAAALRGGSSDASFWRSMSVFSHPIVYGQTIALLAPAALHLAISGRGGRRALGMVALACVAISLYICRARSPLLVAALVLTVYVIALYADLGRPRRMLALAGLVIGIAAASPIAFNWTTDLVSGGTGREAGSTAVRQRQLANARDALQNRPVFGYGPGRSALRAGVRGRYHVLTIDSYYLTLAVDTGFVGLALFGGFVALVLLFGFGTILRVRDDRDRSVVALFCAAVAGVVLGISILSISDELTFVYLAIGVFVAAQGRLATSVRRPVAA